MSVDIYEFSFLVWPKWDYFWAIFLYFFIWETLYINTYQTNLRNDCLSVILFVVVGVVAPAYTSLCIGLEYLLKVRYIILTEPDFRFATLFFFCHGMKTLPYVWKVYHENGRHLRLVAHIFTKLSQNVCLINTHILIYWHARCDCKLWHAPWFYCIFYYLKKDVQSQTANLCKHAWLRQFCFFFFISGNELYQKVL